MKLVHADFRGQDIAFTSDGWFSATEVAAKFGKRPAEWLRLPETERYISALCEMHEVGKSHFVRTRKGGDTSTQGTWLHPKLAVPFARWLDATFAVWCDATIDGLIRERPQWLADRKECSAGYRVMSRMVSRVRELQGKSSAPHHFMNEAKLIGFVLSGQFQGIDRDSLSAKDLALVTTLEVENATLIALGIERDARKEALGKLVTDQQQKVLRKAA